MSDAPREVYLQDNGPCVRYWTESRPAPRDANVIVHGPYILKSDADAQHAKDAEAFRYLQEVSASETSKLLGQCAAKAIEAAEQRELAKGLAALVNAKDTEIAQLSKHLNEAIAATHNLDAEIARWRSDYRTIAEALGLYDEDQGRYVVGSPEELSGIIRQMQDEIAKLQAGITALREERDEYRAELEVVKGLAVRTFKIRDLLAKYARRAAGDE
jgi:chromosome segregation ATPase